MRLSVRDPPPQSPARANAEPQTTSMSGQLRVTAPMDGRETSIKEGYLKKINSLTSARFYFVLDAETLTWWPDKKDAGPRKEVELKHRLLLRNFLAVVGTRNAQGDEFEITYAQGEGGRGTKEHRSVVLRADKGEGRVWVSKLLSAKEVLRDRSRVAASHSPTARRPPVPAPVPAPPARPHAQNLSRHMGAATSTWLRKLNGCQVPGCEHKKMVRRSV